MIGSKQKCNLTSYNYAKLRLKVYIYSLEYDTDMLPGSYPHRYGLYGLKHHIVEMRDGVTDAGQTMTNNKAR